MNDSIIQPPSPDPPLPACPHDYVPGIESKFAVITTIRRRGYWVFFLWNERICRRTQRPPRIRRSQRMKSGGPQTSELAPDHFYGARLSCKHFGLYIDGGGGKFTTSRRVASSRNWIGAIAIVDIVEWVFAVFHGTLLQKLRAEKGDQNLCPLPAFQMGSARFTSFGVA